ncbi:hypothetical protein [Streptomyces laurentii]|uniref:hypothetical protein n=1 Tax=Streptomyces laurentii TaxID=39478 RepID=UPI00340B5F4B
MSRELGCQDDGVEHHAVRARSAVPRRLRLTPERWREHRSVPVEIDGLPACPPRFGLG